MEPILRAGLRQAEDERKAEALQRGANDSLNVRLTPLRANAHRRCNLASRSHSNLVTRTWRVHIRVTILRCDGGVTPGITTCL